MISSTNTIINKGTMMVKYFYAFITALTMSRSLCFICLDEDNLN